jgi:hypothetical protein
MNDSIISGKEWLIEEDAWNISRRQGAFAVKAFEAARESM